MKAIRLTWSCHFRRLIHLLKYFFSAITVLVAGLAPSSSFADGSLPPHLQSSGGYNCLNSFSTPSQQACNQLIYEALRTHGKEDCPLKLDVFDCLGYAFKITSNSSHAKGEKIRELLNFRSLEVEKFQRNQQRAAVSAGASAGIRTFVVGNQAFDLPSMFMRGRGSANATHFDVWTNLHPAETCPEQAFILLNFRDKSDGGSAFESWKPKEDWRDAIYSLGKVLKTASAAGKANGVPACRGASPHSSMEHSIVFYAFDRGNLIGSVNVPPEEIGRDGDGRSFIFDHFSVILTDYAQPLSSKY